jgi:hypothetical protein
MESLQRGGFRVTGFGVGAPDAIGPGIAALQAAVTQYTSGTITNPGGAVAALLTAGTAAVGSVGPAIDALSGNDSTVMGATHLAWVDNGKLANVNSGPSATQADVDAAKAIALDMVNQYQVAQRLAAAKVKPSTSSGRSAATRAPATPSAPDAPPSGGFFGWLAENRAPLLAAGGAAVVAGVGLVVLARSRSA